ncbi:hypothetical protein [Staphylococcus saprophyticus]|uniref:hypothetical protein n=1 Tax=Staphylococcus saprophyticus TaxID=29385 RepID=UPI000853120D|nr:hypothetical protein [Staphylococcus saprophyticus]OEK41286.1 hypothetical protein ASS88_01355 [Staphylococcus saprophyticus]
MKVFTPGEIQCNKCNGIFELKLLNARTSIDTKTVECVYCKNVLGAIQTPYKIERIEIPKSK